MARPDRPSILTVDDDPAVHEIVAAAFRRDAIDLVAATDLAEARAALAEWRFSLVLLDLLLPDGDGRTLLTELRADPRNADTPVFVLSARVAAQTRFASLAAGADGAFEKPVDLRTLVAAIRDRLAAGPRRPDVLRRDPRTGFLQRASAAHVADTARRSPRPSSLAWIAVDGVPWVTDGWGYDVGESMVAHAAVALTAALGTESVLRWGGAEFVAVAPGLTSHELGERLDLALSVLRREHFRGPAGEYVPTTFSAAAVPFGREAAWDDVLAETSRLVHVAMARGGGRVMVSDHAPSHVIPMLLAEDSAPFARAVMRRFAQEGFEVTWCEDGAAAVEAAARQQFALVVTDLEMPCLDGFALIERLRASADHADTPILLMTSAGTEPNVLRAFALGADDYLLKPCSPDELVARARRLVRTSNVGMVRR
jgi:two-component system chemotaxis response regulator CheY